MIETSTYPRPQLRRSDWLSLDGLWDFAEDKDACGETRGFGAGFEASEHIRVPFSPETAASGIGRANIAGCVWYQHILTLNDGHPGKRCIINFEGVDQLAKLWVNGIYIGSHEGAYTRFSFDISNALHTGENLLVLMAQDSFNLEQPRGKQRWLERNFSCWYVQTTGIWKSVWLEFVDALRVQNIKLTPVIEDYALHLEYELSGFVPGLGLDIEISRRGTRQKKLRLYPDAACGSIRIDMASPLEENQICLWRPEAPELYDLKLSLSAENTVLDETESYFAFRDFRCEGDRICLNGMPVYEKLVLYQGYWGDSGLTAPDEAAVVRDLEMIKELGYNGLRIHQKTETETLLYHADRMGLFVWCEMPSSHVFNDNMKQRQLREWVEILRQNYNHPSIVTWLIFNESWGVRGIRTSKEMQNFTDGLYALTKSFDPMRPVISNDGWESVHTDIIGLHNYEQDGERLHRAYCERSKAMNNSGSSLVQHCAFCEGYGDEGQPVIISEFGGCGFKQDMNGDCWGYSVAEKNEDFYERFLSLTQALKKLSYISGYCYTQFSDVEQERNGLVTMDRRYKVDPVIIKKINDETLVKEDILP